MKSLLSGALVAAALAGCAGPAYEEPQSGPRARVRFSTDTTQVTGVWRYGDPACSTDEREVLRLSASPGRSDAAKEIHVPAGRPFYGLFIGADLRTAARDSAFSQVTTLYEQCGVPFSFVFEDGAEYEVALDRARCSVAIARIRRDAPGTAKVGQSTGPMDFPACSKVFERRRFF
jgi:hypothetical protein